jgi:hypothetical protein
MFYEDNVGSAVLPASQSPDRPFLIQSRPQLLDRRYFCPRVCLSHRTIGA